MMLLENRVITDPEELKEVVVCPEVKRLEFWRWEHEGHRILIVEDNLQTYARIDDGIDYIGSNRKDIAEWVMTELSIHAR